jgi:hypothetical protein
MKNIMDQRIRRIEDLLQNETVIGMVASKTDQGIKWNGVTYPDDESLDEAVKTICGRQLKYRPVVVLTINTYGNGEKDGQ